MENCTKYENETGLTCKMLDCDGQVSQWSSDDLKQYCVLKDASHISCLEMTLMYRVMACNVPGSYGYSNEIFPASIWVRNDCYAQFKVCYTTEDKKKLQNDLTNPWFNILFDNKNGTENLYGSVTRNKLAPYDRFTKIRYSTKFPTIPRPPRQKPWTTNSKRKPSSSEKLDADEKDSDGVVTNSPETTSLKPDQASTTTLITTTKETKTQSNITTTKETKTQSNITTTKEAKSQTTKKTESHSNINTTRPSFTSTEKMAATDHTLNKTMKEKNLYFMNSGIIHAGEIDIDVNGKIKHHHLSNDTLDEFEISTSGSGSPLSGSEFLFGAIFGLALLVFLLIGLLLFLFRTKLRRCTHEKQDTTGPPEQTSDITFISGPVMTQYPVNRPEMAGETRNNGQGTTNPNYQLYRENLGFNEPLRNTQYFILEPNNQSNTSTSRIRRESHKFTADEDEGSHKYFVLEDFNTVLSCPRDKDDYDNAVPHPCLGNVCASDDDHSQELQSRDRDSTRIPGYCRIGDTRRHDREQRVSQV